MVCPACPVIGMSGGFLGGYFGINIPKRTDQRVIGAVITSTMIGITVVALKCLFGIALCDGNGNFTLRNIVQVGSISLSMGIVYSIAINYLLNRIVSPSDDGKSTAEKSESKNSWCCKKSFVLLP
jgi:hypothetical protein